MTISLNSPNPMLDHDYFADGIAEDIITGLSRIKWFLVIARNSSFTYKGKAIDVKQIGRELGVRYVLEGSVRKAGSRVRIPNTWWYHAPRLALQPVLIWWALFSAGVIDWPVKARPAKGG